MPRNIPEGAPDPVTYLAYYQETQPVWLTDGTPVDRGLLNYFFNERTSFYPGSGKDGQLLAIFGKSKSVHCHVHADQSESASNILQELHGIRGVYGYEVIRHAIFTPGDLEPFKKPPQVEWESKLGDSLIAVLRRKNEFPESHGPEFQCFLHIHADAYWTYWNMWTRHGTAPFAMILQDHGFSGNLGRKFGGNSRLLEMATMATSKTEFLLVGPNTKSWPGYKIVSGWAQPSGQHQDRRCLYRKRGERIWLH